MRYVVLDLALDVLGELVLGRGEPGLLASDSGSEVGEGGERVDEVGADRDQ